MTPVPLSSVHRALAGATASRIENLLENFLGTGQLFDALNALCIIDGAKTPVTLTELAAQHARKVRTHGAAGGIVTLHELLLRYSALLSKEQVVSAHGYRDAASIVSRFLGDEFPAEDLTKSDLETILKRYSTPASRNGILIRIRAALRWGVREHMIANQLGFELQEEPVRYKAPVFFKPDRVERIMRKAERHPGPPEAAVGMILTLGFFAGVRTAEIMRAKWEDVDEGEKIVRIPQPKGFTRGVRARVVELEPNVVAWLRRWKDWTRAAGLPLRGKIVLSDRLFTEWKQTYLKPDGDSWANDARRNVMRHTYATMHVGTYRDLKSTALNLGHMNNVDTLLQHYRGLVSHTVAKTYWSILPSPRDGSDPSPQTDTSKPTPH